MQIVDHVHEVLGVAVARGRGVVAGDLIAPGAVKRMLRNAHQLHMGVAHVVDILRQLRRQVTVFAEAVIRPALVLFPGAEMYLIDRERALSGISPQAGAHPGPVLPVIGREIRHDGSGLRAKLTLVSVGVRLEENIAFLRLYGKLVERVGSDAGNKEIIDSGFRQKLHPVPSRCPAVKVPHDADRTRVRRPHGEVDAILPVFRCRMSAQLFVNGIMRPSSEQINVQV